MKLQLKVLWTDINLIKFSDADYICITDMIKQKDGDFFVSDWLRNRNTIEFLSIWEEVNNLKFNYGECAIIKSKVWLNNYKISVKEWIEKTNAIGIVAKPGRYWWTYAHKDIAFEFWMWISPKFKIYLIKEFQRLKQDELKILDWSAKRFLTKVNYKIHTDAIKENLIPKKLTKKEINFVYADEADVLNIALFGITAMQWRIQNPWKKWNIRDEASIEQLIILANIESMNAEFIKMWIKQSERLEILNKVSITQMKSLLNFDINKKLLKDFKWK